MCRFLHSFPAIEKRFSGIRYLTKLLRNARVVQYFAQHYQEYLGAFYKIADIESLPA
jgi:hypothetical protein